MLERNKTVFHILTATSIGIWMAQAVLMIVLSHGDIESRIIIPLAIAFGELLGGAMVVFFTLNPQYNNKFTIYWRDGRPHWGRVTYGPDPNGLRYILAGISALVIALFSVFVFVTKLWPKLLDEETVPIVVISIMAVLVIPYYVIEKRLRQ